MTANASGVVLRDLRAACSFVNGAWRTGSAEEVAIRNPADTNEIVGQVRWASPSYAEGAMAAANGALTEWRTRRLDDRISLLNRAVEQLEQQAAAFAELITRENGKTLREARTEVHATVRDAHYQLQSLGQAPVLTSWPLREGGDSRSEISREPLGVMLLITPWNFPLATIARKLIPSLALGNTVVVKPSELAPLTAVRFIELLAHCGLPAGVANLVLGEGATVGRSLVDDPRLSGVSFTGSTKVGELLCSQVASRDVRIQAEMGGKNALVVLADAGRAAALEAAVTGGYGCAGQWCLSTSRVIVERPLYDQFVAQLALRVGQLRLGPGLDERAQMGPLISRGQLERTAAAVARGVEEGACLVTGGAAVPEVDGAPGHYFQPTVFADVTPDLSLAQDEIFGPVVSIMPADNPDDALHLAESTPYGLACSVYTRDEQMADRFMRDVRAGVCHVNLPTFYREAHMPLGGWGASGRGTPECGDFALAAFTRVKAVYRASPGARSTAP